MKKLFIAVAIWLLMMLAFVSGCKEEPVESNEPNEVIDVNITALDVKLDPTSVTLDG